MSEPSQSTGAWTTAFLSSAEQMEQEDGARKAPSARSEESDQPVPLSILGSLDHMIGDLSHPGPITIHGDVEPDLTVHSTGMIVVHGDVRGARLVAGGAIAVSGAVGGPGEAHLDARGEVTVGTARFAQISAGGNLHCRSSLVQCSVTAHGVVMLRRGLGQISGGSIRAGGGILVRRLGSSRGRPTEITLGKAILGDGPGTLDARVRICSDTAARIARRIDQRCGQFDALPEGRAAVVQEIRRLIGERARTLRLQASLVRQRRQAGETPPRSEPQFEAGVVFPGVTLDTGTGPRPIPPTTDITPGGGRGD